MLSSPRYGEHGTNRTKFDSNTTGCKTTESRVTFEELKAQNEKLQHEVYGLNSRINLIYECCADLGVVDHLNDLMLRTRRDILAAQVEHKTSFPNSCSKRNNGVGSSDEQFVCRTSATAIQHAADSNSYSGVAQASKNFHRVRVLEAEEAKLRDQLDIFGVPKLSLQDKANYSRTGDTIDKLLMSANSPKDSTRALR